jgi:hypothetical protein
MLKPTSQKFVVLWQSALEEKLQFAKNLMTGESITRGDELSVAAVEKVCNQIRSVQGKERRLLFLNAKYMTELNASQAKKIEECEWSEEIARRLGKVFDNKVFYDIVLPLKIQKQWTLVIWDFEGREVRVVGFRRDAGKLPIVLLNEFFTNVWKAAAMEGVKTYSGCGTRRRPLSGKSLKLPLARMLRRVNL